MLSPSSMNPHLPLSWSTSKNRRDMLLVRKEEITDLEWFGENNFILQRRVLWPFSSSLMSNHLAGAAWGVTLESFHFSPCIPWCQLLPVIHCSVPSRSGATWHLFSGKAASSICTVNSLVPLRPISGWIYHWTIDCSIVPTSIYQATSLCQTLSFISGWLPWEASIPGMELSIVVIG